MSPSVRSPAVDGSRIRPMRPDEISIAINWAATEGWNPGRCAWASRRNGLNGMAAALVTQPATIDAVSRHVAWVSEICIDNTFSACCESNLSLLAAVLARANLSYFA